MTALDAAGPRSSVPAVPVVASAPAAGPPGTGTARFVGNERAYWRLMVRGALLLMVTLGIYRFWLATDQRRFLWANTVIAGDALEYTGTARELLIGFLIAIAALVPIYAGFFLAALDLGLVGRLSGVIAFVLLALFGHFAIYRARRYRLTRTVFRGVRLHQTGSAWLYAVYSMLWWTVTLATFGLTYPGFVYAVGGINWTALAEAIEHGGDNVIGRIESASPNFAVALAFVTIAFIWSACAAGLLYPAFQAMMLRWWTSGVRFGEMAATSRLRTPQMYGLYLRFMGYSLVFSMIAGVAAGFVFAMFYSMFQLIGDGKLAEIGGVVGGVVSYVVMMLGYSTIYQVTVKLRLWRLSFETAALSGLKALDNVKAAGVPSSAFGEGLADALDVGGL